MTAYDPGRYATEAGYHGAIHLICLTCRDGAGWNNRFVCAYTPEQDATLAHQDFHARAHHTNYHQDTE